MQPSPGGCPVVLGNPIDVCADSRLEASTKEAIKRWEDALGITIFNWVGTDLTQCSTAIHRSLGISSVTVAIDSTTAYAECPKRPNATPPYYAFMCVLHSKATRQWHTMFGQTRVVVNDRESGYTGETNIEDFEHKGGDPNQLQDSRSEEWKGLFRPDTCCERGRAKRAERRGQRHTGFHPNRHAGGVSHQHF